jgi:putative ABC transport system substrate-binding protein
VELLKEIAPDVKRAAIMFNPDTAPGGGSFFSGSFEAAARSLAVEPITAIVRTDTDIERAIAALAREPGAGLVVSSDPFLVVHRALLISLAADHKVPAIYGLSSLTSSKIGGLLSYGTDIGDLFRRSAAYVDRILKGAKPADLPVRAPTKFELVVNLKTARTMGLTIPESFLVRADEVIE